MQRQGQTYKPKQLTKHQQQQIRFTADAGNIYGRSEQLLNRHGAGIEELYPDYQEKNQEASDTDLLLDLQTYLIKVQLYRTKKDSPELIFPQPEAGATERWKAALGKMPDTPETVTVKRAVDLVIKCVEQGRFEEMDEELAEMIMPEQARNEEVEAAMVNDPTFMQAQLGLVQGLPEQMEKIDLATNESGKDGAELGKIPNANLYNLKLLTSSWKDILFNKLPKALKFWNMWKNKSQR